MPKKKEKIESHHPPSFNNWLKERLFEQDTEIYFPEIKELENPVKNILKKLKPDIDKGNYKLIVGEGNSSRIPVFVLGEFIDTMYEKKGFRKKGEGRVKRIFYPFSNKKVNKYIEEVKNKKILITADTIHRGNKMEKLVRDINNIQECDYDIATIGLTSIYSKPELTKRLGKIFHGMNDIPRIDGSQFIAGVKENIFSSNNDTLSIRTMFNENTDPKGDYKLPNYIKDLMSLKQLNKKGEQKDKIKSWRARKDAKILVKNLVKWYENLDKK